jgi:hypothetical protein
MPAAAEIYIGGEASVNLVQIGNHGEREQAALRRRRGSFTRAHVDRNERESELDGIKGGLISKVADELVIHGRRAIAPIRGGLGSEEDGFGKVTTTEASDRDVHCCVAALGISLLYLTDWHC